MGPLNSDYSLDLSDIFWVYGSSTHVKTDWRFWWAEEVDLKGCSTCLCNSSWAMFLRTAATFPELWPPAIMAGMKHTQKEQWGRDRSAALRAQLRVVRKNMGTKPSPTLIPSTSPTTTGTHFLAFPFRITNLLEAGSPAQICRDSFAGFH